MFSNNPETSRKVKTQYSISKIVRVAYGNIGVAEATAGLQNAYEFSLH